MLKKLFIFTALILSFAISADDNLEKNLENTTKELSEVLPQEGQLEDSAFTKYMSEKLKTVIAEYIKENPFSKMDQKEIRTLIDAKLANSSLGNYLKKSPRLYDSIVDIIRDKEAIPAFLSIINQDGKLKKFSMSVFAVFIISFLYTTFFMGGGFLSKVVKKILVTIGVFCLNFGLLYYFFSPELRPGLNIIFKHFHL